MWSVRYDLLIYKIDAHLPCKISLFLFGLELAQLAQVTGKLRGFVYCCCAAQFQLDSCANVM